MAAPPRKAIRRRESTCKSSSDAGESSIVLVQKFSAMLFFVLTERMSNLIHKFRPLSDEETTSKTPVVISCNERRREVAATQVIANKQIDRTFAFDKVLDHHPVTSAMPLPHS
jgi:hypothetical protein